MGIYRGTNPLKAYKGDMQPVNVYKGSTKVAGWHSASYSGTSPLTVDCDYNVPPDALTVDGKCVQVQSCWGTNLVTNGDFSNGTTGWNTNDTTNFSASSNTASFLATSSNGRIYRFPDTNWISGHIYFVSAMVKHATSTLFVAIDGGNVTHNTIITGGSTFSRISMYFTSSGTGMHGISIYDVAASAWTIIQVKYVFCIDLTAAFGAGKEPTASQMDTIMAQFPNSWFDGSAQLSTYTTTYTPNSPSPSFPAPISTITGDVGITGADDAVSNTATVAFGSAVCASLPDGTHDSYDAVTGVLTKRVGKFIGSSGTSWTLSDAETDGAFMCDKITAGNLSGQTLSAPSACVPTVYYKLATPTTVQLTPHLPVVRTGIKTLSVGADVVPRRGPQNK